MNNDEPTTALSRRAFLKQTGVNLGAMALGGLMARDEAHAAGRMDLPHFAPRAKRVIFLTQSGGPSQIELFDHKPGLMKWAGKELPESVRQGQRLTTMTASQKQLIMPARSRFRQRGQSGATVSDWLPRIAQPFLGI